ncbi:MAG: hypothetical protein GX811_02660, partial [Lentisphaerae bacterium]|nr:hypothetical protein [Lentisphaerota bacterium]
MKIATWNVERLKHHKSLHEIKSLCEQTHADILVLTETDERLRPNFKYSFHTPTPQAVYRKGYSSPVIYLPTENRVSIFTNYECLGQHPTFDPYTALCIEVKTEKGRLLVYGTIIGI